MSGKPDQVNSLWSNNYVAVVDGIKGCRNIEESEKENILMRNCFQLSAAW